MLRFLTALNALVVLVPGSGRAQTGQPDLTPVAGRYAPEGECALWPRITIGADFVEVYGWEGGDLLILDRWRDCADCPAHRAAAAGEVRFVSLLGSGAGDDGPVLRIKAEGIAGRMVAEPRGDLADRPELAALIDARAGPLRSAADRGPCAPARGGCGPVGPVRPTGPPCGALQSGRGRGRRGQAVP